MFHVVHMPADNLALPVSHEYCSKASVGVHSAHEIQKPAHGVSLILWPERMGLRQVVQTCKQCFRRQFLCGERRWPLAEWTGWHPSTHGGQQLATGLAANHEDLRQ